VQLARARSLRDSAGVARTSRRAAQRRQRLR
jgi:hypothetical protein